MERDYQFQQAEQCLEDLRRENPRYALLHGHTDPASLLSRSVDCARAAPICASEDDERESTFAKVAIVYALIAVVEICVRQHAGLSGSPLTEDREDGDYGISYEPLVDEVARVAEQLRQEL